VHALRTHLISVTTLETPRHTRALVELTDRDLRLHVLDLLIQVSAADGVISHNEVVVMRQLTTALGLDQADYNALQNSHRHKLSSLRDAED
jgi:uncharacterized tellurite resistance protein B-like protein